MLVSTIFKTDLETKMLQLKVKKLSQTAILPSKNHSNDAAFDLYADEDILIHQGQQQSVKTSIAMEIPDGYAGLIWPRSGMSAKHGIDVLAGVIDCGYRGEIIICLLLNNKIELEYSDYDDKYGVCEKYYKVYRGDKVAQIVIQKIPDIEVVEVEELEESARANSGFGSSGR